MTLPRWAAAALTAALLGVVVTGAAGCGGGGAKGACEPAVREALDPNLGHVLPGAAEPTYLTDPPTSGPHAPGPAPSGVLAAPLSRPAQVGALEAGAVLVQYRDPGDLEALRPLATGQTVVMPNPALPARVVATAWLFKQQCSGVDLDVLRTFATDHAGKGPGVDG
jgi:hypothetical protein